MPHQRQIHWDKLAEIRELKEFFETDAERFKQNILTHLESVLLLPSESLDKFAKLRVLEVTNGVTQWAFRRGDQECLSVEQTRECMHVVMGFMKRSELYFPSEGLIEFSPSEQAFLRAGRALYQDAFKHHVPGKEREYYEASTAQFIAYGKARLQAAINLVKKDYESLFSTYYIDRGQRYIAPYLAGFSEID